MSDAVSAAPAAPSSSPAPSSEPSSAPQSAASASPAPETTPKPNAAPEPKPEPRRLKLKVSGEEREVDEETAVRWAQKGMAADAAFQKAAEERRAFESAKQKLKSPKVEERLEAMKDLGYSDEEIREFAVNLIQREVEREQMDPKDRRIRELEAQQQKIEAERKAAEERQTTEHREAQTKAAAEHFNKSIVPALQKVEVPVTETTVGLVAKFMQDIAQGAAEAGVAVDVNDLVADAAEMAKQELQTFTKATVGKLKGGDLVKFIGMDAAHEIRRWFVEQHKAKAASGQPQNPTPVRAAPVERKPLSQDEWRERLLGA